MENTTTQQFDETALLVQLHEAVVLEMEKQGLPLDVAHITLLATTMTPELSESDRDRVIKNLCDKILAYGPLTQVLQDGQVTEIMVNGPKSIFIEKNGVLSKLDLEFANTHDLMTVINRIVSAVGRRIDAAQPLVDARLADGSRVNAIVPPLSLVGPVLTIRRFPATPLSLDDLVAKNSLTANMARFLKAAVASRLNIIVSGGTGSGKTTLLNALASHITSHERIVTIEDSAEMKITHPHLIGLEARQANIEGKGEVPIRQLVKNSLRMRPDRIIVGEIRSGEAVDMLQAMNTGHEGSLTTVHANAPLEALYRVETMCLMSDVELPLAAIRQQIRSAVHIVIQQERLSDGTRKVTSISSVSPSAHDETAYSMKELFAFDKQNKVHTASGELPYQLKEFSDAGVELASELFI